MTFPLITFKHTNVDSDQRFIALITNKLSSLQKYLGDAKAVRIEVEFERIPSHQSGLVCRVETNVWRGDQLFRVEATTETFEQSIDTVKSSLETELERAHDKRVNVVRRTARRFKEMVRWHER